MVAWRLVYTAQAQRDARKLSRAGLADKARDLEEIAQRLLNEKHNPEEIAELLYAFQKVAGYIRSYSKKLGIPIVEIFDRVKGFGTGFSHDHTNGLFSRGNARAKGSKRRVK